MRHLGDVFQGERALNITPDRIGRYTIARLEAGVKPASVNRELAALRRMFSLACKVGMLATRPHVAMLAEDNAREGFLEPSDFAAVQTHLPRISPTPRVRVPERLAEGRDSKSYLRVPAGMGEINAAKVRNDIVPRVTRPCRCSANRLPREAR